MPQPPLDDALAQAALDAFELAGDKQRAADALGWPRSTLCSRLRVAELRGLKPTVRREAPRLHTPKRLGRMHLVIPDVQAKAGVPLEHLGWVGNYIVEKKPDVIVQIGDFADMPSLSLYDKGKLKGEGRRYTSDIAAVHRAMDTLLKPLADYNRTAPPGEQYHPEMHLTLGNHEYRIMREVEDNPKYEGKFSYDDLGYEDYGWTVHPFLEVLEKDGIEYSHYFTTGPMGRPCTTAPAMLRERHRSCTQGHLQHTDIAVHKKTQHIALMAGTCYLHDEDYLGPQGNSARRQIVVKHEVDGKGRYDLMLVSLAFLKSHYD